MLSTYSLLAPLRKKLPATLFARWPGMTPIWNEAVSIGAPTQLQETSRGGLANIGEGFGVDRQSRHQPHRGGLWPRRTCSAERSNFRRHSRQRFRLRNIAIGGLHELAYLHHPGRGAPYGLTMAPVIKVASRTALAKRWKDVIDVNAGTIASGEETIEEVGKRIFDLVLDVASGRRQTWADRWGLHNEYAPFNPAPIT
jgi:galactarate dehydratase